MFAFVPSGQVGRSLGIRPVTAHACQVLGVVGRSRLMLAAVGTTPHCRLPKHTRAAGFSSVLKPCSVKSFVWPGPKKGSTCSNKLRKSAGCASSHRSPLEDTQSVPASHATPVCPSGYRIRRAEPDEADQVAELNAEVHVRDKACVNRCILPACVPS